MNLGTRANQHNFARIPSVNQARSAFDRSSTAKDTLDFDYLNPIFLEEVLPGDTMNMNCQTFMRLATQKVPIMDNMYVDFFWFFIPSRLLWENWQRFMGEQPNPGDSTDFTIPVHGSTDQEFAVGSLGDKFGLPTAVDLNTGNRTAVNALPFRAYNLVWNEWFRDQNLQNRAVVDLDNGPDDAADYILRKRGKRHDYFTSCLPWPQKGPSVEFPIAGTAPVIGNGEFPLVIDSTSSIGQLTLNSGIGVGTTPSLAIGDFSFANQTGLVADLSESTAATINQIREAFMVQSIFELDARGGTRYIELLLAHFGVTAPDFRLQRPEYLGGGSSTINSHIVPQTTPTEGSNAQAQLAAYATQSSRGNGFTKSFVEHGYVLGLCCARADITYQQGLERLWARRTRFDFFWPKLQELGEQAVYNAEIYVGDNADDQTVFGYQERYAEYRYKPSQIRGEFRSTFAQSLDFWHMAQEFDTRPSLNASFIEQSTPIERAIAVTNAPHLLADFWFKLIHTRPMATYSVPASLGRF